MPAAARVILKALLAALALAAGCATNPGPLPPASPPPGAFNVLAGDRGFGRSAELWRAEGRKRWGVDPFVLVAHGSADPDSPWMLSGGGYRWQDADFVAAAVRAAVPRGTPVLLITCNEGGHRLSVPGVWYAPGKVVWATPYACWSDDPTPSERSRGVGGIENFVEGGQP
jgi:hypothetical protein